VTEDLFLLDAGPLGLVTNPRGSPDSIRCAAWMAAALATGARVMVPAIADYEVRRELVRAGKAPGIAHLDATAARLGTLPVDEWVWHRAADLWAQARRQGTPTAADAALDGDMILAATAQLAAEAEDGSNVVVVTNNIGHLGRFVDARLWTDLATAGE
jgi:predicted nucleic acid-binding protein